MKIELTGLKQIQLVEERKHSPIPKNWIYADVIYCGICRTDAKLWSEGQRDLVLPRVPGHEIVVEIENQHFTIWPGIVCGTCKHCISGDENLCESIRIIGFHEDGGFASKIAVPENCLIQLPNHLSPELGCFAEPAGCVINGFKKLQLQAKDRILILGGGTVGLLAAAMAKLQGAIPTVLEKNESKIQKAKSFSEETKIQVLKETNESKFDCVINACADPLALMSGITRLDKAGRMVHFSGLNKNEQLETNLFNLIHYKELRFSGSYGLTKFDMINGLNKLINLEKPLLHLTEAVIAPDQVESCLRPVLKGDVYKYIIQLGKKQNRSQALIKEKETDNPRFQNIKTSHDFIPYIPPIDESLRAAAQEKIDHKTKPLGALGSLEKLSVQMSYIQSNLNPRIRRKGLIVFAADHGIAEEGVSAYPQEVTAQMVKNFLKNGAAINVLCNHLNIDLSIVDVGVKTPLAGHTDLIHKRIANGTRNFALEPAMTQEQAIESLKTGAEIFKQLHQKQKFNVIGLGEMGIANTTSATAIISAITQKSIDDCTGRGTGVDNQGLEHKIKVIRKALQLHKLSGDDALEVLTSVGGFEIGAIAGATLAAASQRCAIVLDGLISTAAGLIAYQLNPSIQPYLIAGHKSVEQGHIYALEKMGINPILDLNMRVGEGTGAALSIDLIEASCKIMSEMASFDEAGVTGKKKQDAYPS